MILLGLAIVVVGGVAFLLGCSVNAAGDHLFDRAQPGLRGAPR